MKLGLLGKMLLFILLPVLIGTALLSGISYKMGDTMIREQIDSDSRIVLDTAGTGMDAVFTGLREGLLPVTENLRLVHLAEAYANGGEAALTDELREGGDRVLKSFVQGSNLVHGSYLLATDGYVLAERLENASGPGSDVGKKRSDQPYFREAMSSGQTAVSTIFLGNGEVMTVIAEPIRHQGRILGVATARLRNSDISRNTTDKVIIGKKGRCYAYSLDGRFTLTADNSAMGRDDKALPHVRTLLQNRTGKLEFTNERGESKFLSYKELPHEHWILCVEVDKEEILTPTHNLLRNVGLLALLVALVIGGMILITARGIARMTGGLAGIADSVACGRLEANGQEEELLETAVQRGDEFSTLSTAMRSMMGSLKKLIGESEDKTRAAEE
ncbi:MAG: cache domain-containing protein, partial [Desulfovibrio sp.]|nr:cache domain-containing protein [Desulfovibrio sp.]